VVENQQDEWQADLKAFGVADDDIKKASAVLEANTQISTVEASTFLLWPDHAGPLTVFDASATQWRLKSNGMAPSTHVGLDYAAVKIMADAEGVALGKQGWRDLRVLEDEALNHIAKIQAKP
jgi:Phage related hypothetical protein (DUF1799)